MCCLVMAGGLTRRLTVAASQSLDPQLDYRRRNGRLQQRNAAGGMSVGSKRLA
jgi:hypothetical protein